MYSVTFVKNFCYSGTPILRNEVVFPDGGFGRL